MVCLGTALAVAAFVMAARVSPLHGLLAACIAVAASTVIGVIVARLVRLQSGRVRDALIDALEGAVRSRHPRGWARRSVRCRSILADELEAVQVIDEAVADGDGVVLLAGERAAFGVEGAGEGLARPVGV